MDNFATRDEVAAFIALFEAAELPRVRWTHRGHLVAGFWYLSLHPVADALGVVRRRIRRHNESVGTANTDSSGYHETITRLYLAGIAAHRARRRELSFEQSLQELLASALAESRWPLTFYSSERLFSVAARRDWVEPDLKALDAELAPHAAAMLGAERPA
jgi:hypothetical protein